jgi:hypothetical protein
MDVEEVKVEEVKVRGGLHQEFRSISNAFAAFSLATLLLIFQGSFDLDRTSVALATCLLLVAVPLCFGASILSYVFILKDSVPVRAEILLDRFMNVSWSVATVGFLALAWSVNPLFSILFFVASALSLCVAVRIHRIFAQTASSGGSK